MANTVTTTFFADEKAATAALARLEKKYADLEHKLKQVSKQSRDSAGIVKGIDRWVGSLGAVAAGYLALPALIDRVADANRELLAQADQAALKYDVLFRRIRIQAGFTAGQSDEAKKRILNVALGTATPSDVAAGAAEELASQGFKAEDATGAALDVLLKGMKASNLGGDPRAIAQAASQFLAANGLEKTTKNLEEALIAVQRTFKDTPLQLNNLSALASRTEAISGKLSMKENLAAFTILREVEGDDRASTDLSRVVSRLATASATPEKIAALRKLNLKTADVDFVGEGIGEVLDRLDAGLAAMPEKDRAPTLMKLFGEEGVAGAAALIRNRGRLPGLMEKMGDKAGFEADVAIATSGKAASRTREELLDEMRLEAKDTDFTDKLNAAEQLDREKGKWGITSKANRWVAEWWKNRGASDDTALYEGFGGWGGSSVEEINKRAEGLSAAGGDPRLLELMQKNNELMEQLYEEQVEANRRARGASRREEVGAS